VDLLDPDDAEAGVAARLIALASAHGAVADQRRIRGPQGALQWSSLRIRHTGDHAILTLEALGAELAARRCVRHDRTASGTLRSAVRHDLYAPLSTAASALELLEADVVVSAPDTADLASTIRAAVQDAADRSLALGTSASTPAGGPADWVETRVLVDAALDALRPGLLQRGIVVTRGVCPVVFARPDEIWRRVEEAVGSLRFAGSRGSHVHLEPTEPGEPFALQHRTVREAAAANGPWAAPAEPPG
jgi:hypothetical protein